MYKLKVAYENKNTREKEEALADILKIVGVASRHKEYAAPINKIVGTTVKEIRASRRDNFATVTLSRRTAYREVKGETTGGILVGEGADQVVANVLASRACKEIVFKHQKQVKFDSFVPTGKRGTKGKAVPSRETLMAAVKELKGKIVGEIRALRKDRAYGAVASILHGRIYEPVTGSKRIHPTLAALLTTTEMPSLPGFKVLRDGKNLPCYYEEGTFIRASEFKSLRDMLNGSDLKPVLKDRHLGIELEVLSKIQRKELGEHIHAAGLSRYVRFADDGSLRADETYRDTLELRVLVKESDLAMVITKLCTTIAPYCKVNGTCGMHVHLDMREVSGRDVKVSYHNLVTMQHFLLRMLSPSRTTGSYSRPNTTKVWGEPNAGAGSSSRYYCVNPNSYSKHKTIEIRAHSGTIDATKILNWCQILIGIVNSPKIARSPTTLGGFQLATSVGSEVLAYMQSRLWKFKAQHIKHATPLSEVIVDEPSATINVNNEESEA